MGKDAAGSSSDFWIKTLCGLLSAAVCALSAWVFSTHADIALIKSDLILLKSDNETDSRQNEAISKIDRALVKFWKLHNWAKDEINELRVSQNFPILPWPDLEN